MRLLTKAIEAKLPDLYSTDGMPYSERPIIVKFYCPWNEWKWYVLEGCKMEDGEVEFFGLVDGEHKELGYFYLSQLEGVEGPLGIRIERDVNFQAVLSDLIPQPE